MNTQDRIQRRLSELDSRGEHRSDREIADELQTSRQYVSQVRQDLAFDGKLETVDYFPVSHKKHKARRLLAFSEDLSQSDVANKTGLSRRTVGKISQELANSQRETVGKQTLIHGDFLSQDFEPESFDAIVTDPPYTKEHIPLWSDFGRVAERVLKPSGFVVALAGQQHLDKEIARLSENLDYYWTICINFNDQSKMAANTKAISGWRTVLVFQKPPRRNDKSPFEDTIQSYSSEKDRGNWQQSVGDMRELLDRFTEPGDRVLDPFVGTGTTLGACRQMGRHGVGVELDQDTYQVARDWIESESKPSRPVSMSFAT